MKIPPVILLCLLPYITIAEYDESSTRKINLEDIEDDHIKHEKQSQSAIPPPLSKQPAKGQPVQMYPPLSNEAYPIPNLYETHQYSTRPHQHAHVQPLTDQPIAPPPEAGYQHQQSAPYHGQSFVYLAAPGAGGHPLVHNPQQMYASPPPPEQRFYYSHDLPQQQPNEGANPNDYQLQFVPIGQHDGSNEQQQQQQQHSFHGPSQVTVPSTAAPVVPVSYSHDMNYDVAPQPEMQHQQHYQAHQQEEQQQPTPQYQINNAIHEPNYVQHVYGLPPDVFFQSQRDIQYAKPEDNYGATPIVYYRKEEYPQRDYSQDDASPPKPRTTPESIYQQPAAYSEQVKSIEYQTGQPQKDSSSSNSHTSTYRQSIKPTESALSYGYAHLLGPVTTSQPQTYISDQQNLIKYSQKPEEQKSASKTKLYEHYLTPSAPSQTQTYYLNHLKNIKTVQHGHSTHKPSVIYGPPDTVGKDPNIIYGVPEAPFRRPVVQSNQDVYAPRRPSSAARSNEKPFAVSFPYPPSFVSFTTEKPKQETTTKAAEKPINNEINSWIPIHGTPSVKNQYRSYTQAAPQATHSQQSHVQAAPQTTQSQHSHVQAAPQTTQSQQYLPDLFHTRRAKSLLESYIPSWLVTRMQEEYARLRQQAQTIVNQSQQTEDTYNTIPYSSHEYKYDGKHLKRSLVPRNKISKKFTEVSISNEEMTAME